MASSTPHTWRYHLYANFHGPDVRKSFLSHLRKQLIFNGISMFDDEGFDHSREADCSAEIRASRISVVLLTKNYASSSGCLDELLEILWCKEEMGQIVMTVFYGVYPSHVRRQTGEFGEVFKETCARKTEEERERWSQALNVVGNIAGEQLQSWDDESKMIEKIARDVSNKLNLTTSRDFEDVVGIEAHLEKMQSLLHLDDEDGVMMVGITGPAGIGKTTIARALHNRLSSCFQLTCFMENVRGSYNSGLDEYGSKLCLQEKLLSKIFDHNGIRIYHLAAIPERLCHQNVLIILDGVDDLKQLEALANETTWFGPGSRIIITTEDQELLEQHDINNTYHVDLPSTDEALEILCRYAFKQSYPHNGFQELAESIVDLCGKLPLGLRVVGSSLLGKKKEEWENLKRSSVDCRDARQVRRAIREPSLGKSQSRYSTAMAFLVVINLLLEIASAVSDQFSSIRKPYFARISLVMSLLSVVLSILDLAYKIRVHKACFRCKWPIPWFYYPSRGYKRIFGSYTDTVLLFCVVGQLIVSTINCSFTERRRDGPIKVSVWPLFFAIGMVASKFIEKTPISKQD